MSEIKLPKMHKPPLPEGYRLPDYKAAARNAPPLAVENVVSCCCAVTTKGKPSQKERLARFIEQEERIAERQEEDERKKRPWAFWKRG